MQQDDYAPPAGQKPPPRPGWSVRRLMIVLAVLSVPLAWVVTPAVRFVWKASRFFSEYQHLQDQIDSLQTARPAGFDPVAWDEAWGWSRNYLGNIVSFDRSIPAASLRGLADEIEAKVQAGQVDSSVFPWLYSRIAGLNPSGYGAGYDRRFRVQGVAPLIAGEFERHPPIGVAVADWKEATQATWAACIDVYYQSGLADEDRRLAQDAAHNHEDLLRALDGPFTVDALSALWDRLAAVGPEAATYVEEHRPAVLLSK